MLPGPDDRRLAKRLHRDARAAAKAQLRAELIRARAIRRRERRIRKARAALPGQLVATVGLGLVSIPVDGFWGVAAVGAACVGGLGALRSVRVLRSPVPPPLPVLPALPAVPMPPPVGSVAFPYVRRLEAVRDELRRLLPLVAPAGREPAEEAWQAAGEADTGGRVGGPAGDPPAAGRGRRAARAGAGVARGALTSRGSLA